MRFLLTLLFLLLPTLVLAQSGGFDFQLSLNTITPSIVPAADSTCTQFGPCQNGMSIHSTISSVQGTVYQPNNYVSSIDDWLPTFSTSPGETVWNGQGANPVGFYSTTRGWGPNSVTWPWNSVATVEPGATNGGTQLEYDFTVNEPTQYAVGGYYIMASPVVPGWSPVLDFAAWPNTSWSHGIISETGAVRIAYSIGALTKKANSLSQPLQFHAINNRGQDIATTVQTNGLGQLVVNGKVRPW